jgi:hypothetical protein
MGSNLLTNNPFTVLTFIAAPALLELLEKLTMMG